MVRQAVHQAVVNQARLIRLPIVMNSELYRLRKASDALESRLNRRNAPGISQTEGVQQLTS